MKNDVQAVVETSEKLLPKAAHVEISEVQFAQNPNLGLVFYNQIDAWRKMEVVFKHKITRPHVKRDHKEFETLYYSFRDKIF